MLAIKFIDDVCSNTGDMKVVNLTMCPQRFSAKSEHDLIILHIMSEAMSLVSHLTSWNKLQLRITSLINVSMASAL